MKDSNKKKGIPEIGENTKWDSPLKKAKNGVTVPKPSISLKPKKDSEK